MYCRNCGKEIDEQAAFCPYCGTPVQENRQNTNYNYSYGFQEETSGLLKVICFLIPLIGLILFIVYMDTKPQRSHDCGKMALIGFIVGIVLYGCSYGMLLSSL